MPVAASWYRRQRRTVIAIIGSVLYVGAGACTTKSDAGDTVGASAIGRAAPVDSSPHTTATTARFGNPDFVADPPEIDNPAADGQLSGDLGDVATYDGPKFRQFTRSRGWFGWKRARDCEGMGCNGNSNDVIVQAIEDANLISAKKFPKNHDVVVARITNVGGGLDPVYKDCALPSQSRGIECYIIVRYTGSAVTLTAARLTALETSAPKLELAPLGTGKYSPCGHPKRRFAVADFATCDEKALVGGRLALTGSRSSPVWMTCAEGCCSSTYPLAPDRAWAVALPAVPR
jgi:hypothetical protein